MNSFCTAFTTTMNDSNIMCAFLIGLSAIGCVLLNDLRKDGHLYFDKYWDMWTERNHYFDEMIKWKTKYLKLKRELKENGSGLKLWC